MKRLPSTPWLSPLSELRSALTGRRDARGHIGSLRWLEQEVQARGGTASTVRNILYRDVGTLSDKHVLLEVLTDLASSVDLRLTWPVLPLLPPSSDAERLLDREKRRIYRRFVTEVSLGHTARMIVITRPGAGKTLLVDHVSRALPDALLLRFEQDFAPELTRLSAALGLSGSFVPELLARLADSAPYAINGAVQQELTQRLVRALKHASASVLLIRVDATAHLRNHPLRLGDGSAATPSAWIWHHLLAPLADTSIAVLVALSNADGLPDELPGYQEPVVLQPPSLDDMRRYVRTKLPSLPTSEVERIARSAGRDYDSLGLLTLLTGVGHTGDVHEPLPPLPDTSLRHFLEALFVACSTELPHAPARLLEALADEDKRTPLAQRRDLERAFVEPATAGHVRPANVALLTRLVAQSGDAALSSRLTKLHARAARVALELGETTRALHHALKGQIWEIVVQTAGGEHAELAWSSLRGITGTPQTVTEHVAKAVVEHHANLGRYAHRSVTDALEVLERSDDPDLRVWSAVKSAERLIDAARYDEARDVLARLTVPDDLLDASMRVELGLIRAAFARWEGQAAAAEQHVKTAADSLGQASGAIGNKVRTWRGLIARDLGAWHDAIEALSGITSDATALPLQQDRAHAHLADVWMRLGQFPRAHVHVQAALDGLLSHGASAEEITNSRARLGTVLRRLGQLGASLEAFEIAARTAPDDFTLARVYSEATLLHAALEHHERALQLGNWAWRQFKAAEPQRPLEAVYRRHRLEYRVALAYLCRGLNCRYLPPLHGARHDNEDLAYARELLSGVLEQMPGESALRVDAHLALALATPDPRGSVEHAANGIQAATWPYNRMQAHAFMAEALLRAGNADDALAQVNLAHVYARSAARQAHEVILNDPGYAVWLFTLEAEAIARRDARTAWQTYRHALNDTSFHGFQAGVASSALRVLSDSDVADEVQRQLLPDGPGLLRTEDALSSWIQVTQP